MQHSIEQNNNNSSVAVPATPTQSWTDIPFATQQMQILYKTKTRAPYNKLCNKTRALLSMLTSTSVLEILHKFHCALR